MPPPPGPLPVSQRRVPPDPSITSAIGLHHSLPTAIADLVDNSIDAEATHVLVRFLVRDGRPVGLLVVDDGFGMDNETVDHAMTYAHKREYDGEDLGHFGVGMKAASLSQALTLMVWSRRYGSPAVGRRLQRETVDSGPIVETYSAADATRRLQFPDLPFALETGTVIEWDRVTAFLTSLDEQQQTEWLERTIQDLLTHLGVVLHRILARGDLSVQVEIYDAQFGAGIPRTVEPINPFAYGRSRTPGYPTGLELRLAHNCGQAILHVWPEDERGNVGFALGGRNPMDSQGLYVYRKDRLLQAGGWNELTSRAPDLTYARVAIDIDDALEPHVRISPEKDGTTFDSDLAEAFHHARTTAGGTFDDFLDAARGRAQQSNRRRKRPITVPPPGDGLPRTVLDAFEEHTDPTDGFPVDIRWRVLPEGQVFRVDRDAPALVLNARYRSAVTGSGSLRNDDAPLVKSLLFLLLADHFEGVISGNRKKRLQETWQSILLAAIKEQAPAAMQTTPQADKSER